VEKSFLIAGVGNGTGEGAERRRGAKGFVQRKRKLTTENYFHVGDHKNYTIPAWRRDREMP